ncbi:hypothetical protein ACQR3W_21960 [Rhodococcus ruber]|uniref:hypothetical protein n=1 Tax=Rhodococcus ruber TaxID=1830 RepID=UPI00058BA0F3|nr:hypothetical protein [Rhodococcus ruber]MCZ4505915.1 hypothetical protein [Rhodococcus ruber]MCZ4533457.1 hypothetical protein [Rhodococcus ruber]
MAALDAALLDAQFVYADTLADPDSTVAMRERACEKVRVARARLHIARNLNAHTKEHTHD